MTGLSCSTAYGRRCRCYDCRKWNAEHSRRGRRNPDEQRKAVHHTVRMHALWAEADEAFRTDPAFVIEMAKAWWD